MRVMVFGTFDDLHPGHRYFLQHAQKRAGPAGTEHGGFFIVVARDSNVRRIKGREPQYSEMERVATIRGAIPGAEVLLGHPTDFLHFIREFQPDLLVLGYDQQLPPGILSEDLPMKIERLPSFEPERWKSSTLRKAPMTKSPR